MGLGFETGVGIVGMAGIWISGERGLWGEEEKVEGVERFLCDSIAMEWRNTSQVITSASAVFPQ